MDQHLPKATIDGAAQMAAAARHPDDDPADTTAPWELIDLGRYQPRRIRGSCRGRALG
jgi:hypothetical protein